ncbi:MAG: hypothetical protein AAF497_02315 [Planctomycetota bacterium]
MLSLVIIPVTALVALLLLFLSTRYQYQVAERQLVLQAEKDCLSALEADQANDSKLIQSVASNQGALRELIDRYNSTRTKLSPIADRDWTEASLRRCYKHRIRDKSQAIGRKLFHRTCILALVIFTAAICLAILRYHFLSGSEMSPSTPLNSPAATDPFAVSP